MISNVFGMVFSFMIPAFAAGVALGGSVAAWIANHKKRGQ